MEKSADFISLPFSSGPPADSGRQGNISRDYHSSRSGRDDRRDRDTRDREWDRGHDRDRDRRRRSRSPRHSSRREYDNDAYSSSRDYREREREDRHRGGDRDGWDRDRGARRDRRDDDRPRRADRDAYDDRRRGRDREERREPSPPKKREPTPDLTNVVPLDARKRRMTQWDVKPVGYEQVTAEQAKLSGMFPLPGAPRAQAVDQSRLQALLQQPGATATSSSLLPVNSRVARRLIVTRLPPAVTEQGLTEFINLQLNDLAPQSNPCLDTSIPKDNATWALATFRTPEDATLALHVANAGTWTMPEHSNAGNGVMNGAPPALTLRRPNNYIQPTGAEDDAEAEARGGVSRDSANKIVITRIPEFIDEAQVTELLQVYGHVKNFVMVKNRSNNESAGIVFCDFDDAKATDAALEQLNNLQLGTSTLKAERACVGNSQTRLDMNAQSLNLLARSQAPDGSTARVIQLLNMVTGDELVDNDEYEEIYDDVRREVSKYGKVLDLKIPRPSGARTNPGVGKIFIKFETPEVATKALEALGGRKFSDRTVVTAYYDEEQFDVEAW